MVTVRSETGDPRYMHYIERHYVVCASMMTVHSETGDLRYMHQYRATLRGMCNYDDCT